jgi:predicted nucleotidyltransferase
MRRRQTVGRIAKKYDLQIMYAFGSRAQQAEPFLSGLLRRLPGQPSDLDLGVKPARRLTVEEKVEIALALEGLFGVSRVDLVILPEASVFLAAEIVKGALLYAKDPNYEAEYQLYILRQEAELLPFERRRLRMILGA